MLIKRITLKKDAIPPNLRPIERYLELFNQGKKEALCWNLVLIHKFHFKTYISTCNNFEIPTVRII